MGFINDKVAEMLAAKDSGDDQALLGALTEAISENDKSPLETLAQMTEAARQQRGV
ncbi:hypothetical protein [Streptomyces longwoodensis]|uniref:hypothetical protein n=1 Tax=Streptomyces longwoodensis TaxID=68231 RepID=UPI0033CD166A